MEVLEIISDLALLLVVAGFTTVLCKKFNLPGVLGYIVAGILIGGVVSFLPQVGNRENIELWSELGVIFLMFGLGLEFSVHKMKEVGSTGIISCLVEVLGMLLLGFLLGRALGYDTMNAIFLGGMISMSSTMITIKAIEDAGMKEKRFAQLAIGTLVIEDIAAIFMMMILSMLAVSQGVSGMEMAENIGLMLFYLVVWLLLGIYVIPSLLKKTMRLMNNETLLVMSLGICFAMSWLANLLGFSTALGAFLAGSILAGTVHAERIEHLVAPCKDLFGAVFFVSVGMMVEPAMLLKYWLPILIITVLIIVGKFILLTFGMLLAGEDVRTSVYCATSQTQIGEFSFILAALGLSLGVTGDFLYPMIVAISVITTITTPFCLKSSDGIIALLEKLLPKKMLYPAARQKRQKTRRPLLDPDWKHFLRGYSISLAIYTLMALGLILIGVRGLYPLLQQYLPHGAAALLALLLIWLFLLPFLPNIATFRDRFFTTLWLKGMVNRVPLSFFMVLRMAVAVFVTVWPLFMLFEISYLWALLLIGPLVWLAVGSDKVLGLSIQLQARFFSNFNERILKEQDEQEGSAEAKHIWLNEQLFIADYLCAAGNEWIGKSLADLEWPRMLQVKVVRIIRANRYINIPVGTERIHKGDVLVLMGEERSLENFRLAYPDAAGFVDWQPRTLRQYIEEQDDVPEGDQLLCCAVCVYGSSPLAGKNLRESGIKEKWNCFLIGLERHLYPMIDPDPNTVLLAGDLLWVLGSQKMGSTLLMQHLLDEEETPGKSLPGEKAVL